MNDRRTFTNLTQCAVVLTLILVSGPVIAGECPHNPAALGTSRTIVVDPSEHRRIGIMQYHESLPLQDHEVVITFDDGPLPPHTNAVLDTLASECVKATFFMIGRMAKEFPDTVRRVFAEGHTVGTHSNGHPRNFGQMPMERITSEIEDGIANTVAALGDDKHLAPFFRIPGLRNSDAVETYLADRNIMIWSSDFLADDWRHISSSQVTKLALERLEAYGKGILLLHDIHRRTQEALPVILRELKERGYRIVHVEFATPDRPKTPTEPSEWRFRQPFELSPVAKMSAQSVWLASVPSNSAAEAVLLPSTRELQMSDVVVGHVPTSGLSSKSTVLRR